ncbi:MAG: hypothetical protein K0S09_431 [Sphingobacteriaceae bacterium]|jgi:hypothetical protein|nr:hypothetical protein [Sphingobacteriaceae bacterium]
MEKLTLFFSKIKEITLWQRLFGWGIVRSLSYDAFEEFRSLENNLRQKQEGYENLKNTYTKILTERENLGERVQDLEKAAIRKESQIEALSAKADELNASVSALSRKLSAYESVEEQKQHAYESKIRQIEQVKVDLDAERKRIADERLQEQENAFLRMKKQWQEHEAGVEQVMKNICQKHFITYVEKVPFKGNPDNTVEICGEYIVFDSKCPSNNDLVNFPKYIRSQTELVKKYVNQENVKKDIFLVIPSNTVDTISQLVYNLGDYNVFVITKDSLEPVLLALKKLEEYEFANQLSPDERDNICRVLGKFAHTTKRKIQIDQYFASQFINLLVKCKDDLPAEILEQVVEFEKAERLNPPTEKRAKQILTKDLADTHATLNAEAQIRKIEIPGSIEEFRLLE